MQSFKSVLRIFVCAMVVVVFAGCQQKDTTPSAALWQDGAWVLYKQVQTSADGKIKEGTLKISSVGKEMIDNEPYFWIEMREDSKKGVKITKFLVSEKKNYNPDDSFVFWDEIKRIIIQEDAHTPEEIPAQHLKRFTPIFVESPKAKRFGNVQDQVQPEIKTLPPISINSGNTQLQCTGKEFSKNYTSSVNLGFLHLEDTTESSTVFYTHPDIPFGNLAKVVYSSTTTSLNKLKPDEDQKPPEHFENSLELQQFGTSGATSQIIGDPVEKEILPFPFLQKTNN